MIAWWSSTTSVRKVRARSSARLRDLACGIARMSAVAAVEIDVMGAPGRLFAPNVAGWNLIQQGLMTSGAAGRRTFFRSGRSGHFLDLDLVRIERQTAGDVGH